MSDAADWPAGERRELELELLRPPPLPLAPGHLRRWGLYPLLLAAVGKPLRGLLPGDEVQIALHPRWLPGGIPVFHPGRWLQERRLPLTLHVMGVQPSVLDTALQILAQRIRDDGARNPLQLSVEPLAQDSGWEHSSQQGSRVEPDTDWALDVVSPLPFKRQTLSRTRFEMADLVHLVQARMRKVFAGAEPELLQAHLRNLDDAVHQGQVLCGYWNFVDIPRASASQNRQASANQRRERLVAGDRSLNLHHHSGCAGRLFLRDPHPALIQALQWLHPWHLHASDGVAVWAQSSLEPKPAAWFDKELGNVEALLDVARGVYLDHEAPHPAGTAAPPIPRSESELAVELAAELSRGDYMPSPAQRFALPKAGGGVRWVERLELKDLVAQKRLSSLLGSVLDRLFSPLSLGYRKGLSRKDATDRVRQLIREGHRWVIEADIHDFFPSAELDRIEQALDDVLPHADHVVRRLVHRMLYMPWVEPGLELPQTRTRGLAQGAPISSLMANLLLDQLDRALESRVQGALVRYADDFVVLTRSQTEAQTLLTEIRGQVERLGLSLAEDKTHVRPVAEGFEFLGEHFSPGHAEPQTDSLTGQCKPLVITDSYLQLGLNGQALDIKRNGHLIDTIPLRRISELIVLGRNSLSTALMNRLAQHRIPLSIAVDGGHQIAVLNPDSRRYHEIMWQQSRWFYGLSPSARTSIAQAFVEAKLLGYTALVRLRTPVCPNTLATLQSSLRALSQCTDVAMLRGHEGLAAKATFAWLQNQIRPDLREAFRSPRRARGAGDRLNSLLNFGYYLSFTRLNGLVRAHGLNPYLGFLHDGLDDYETLVADLQELMRPFVDRVVIQLVNQGMIGPEGFESTERGLYLKRPAIRTFVMEFERAMGQKVFNQRLADMLVTQVRILRAFMGQGGPLWLFHLGLTEKQANTKTPWAPDLETSDMPDDPADGDDNTPWEGGGTPENSPAPDEGQ